MITRFLTALRCLWCELAECWRLIHQDKSWLNEIEDKYNLF